MIFIIIEIIAFDAIGGWFYSLGENYGVNPLIFGAIYVGAIPFFSLSIAQLIKKLPAAEIDRSARSVGDVFLYLGAYSTVKKIRKQI